MARTATAKWGLPTERQSGLPADPSEVQGVEIALRVNASGAPFSVLEPMVPPDTLELVIPDLTPGDYQCRYVPIDTDDDRGAEALVDFNIPDDTPLAAVENPTVEVSGP